VPGSPTVEEQRNLEVMRQVARAWNAGDLDGMLEHYSDDVEIVTDPSWPDPSTRGKDAFRRASEGWREAWEQIQVDVEELEARDHRVIAHGVWVSKGASSGVAGDIPFAIVYELEDGLITRGQWYMDPEEARRAAG
jgi:ketosteroid isomerase-like protein